MKKLVGYILAFYILFSSVVPCSVFDHCEEENATEQTSNSEQEKDCNDCSPFSICSTASGFTINSAIIMLAPGLLSSSPIYSDFQLSSKSEYHSTLFQPPRLG